VHEWASDEQISPATKFFSQPAVAKTVAILNAGLALRKACDVYWTSKDVAAAKAILGKARTYLLTESQAFESSVLADEANLVNKLDQNLGEVRTDTTTPVDNVDTYSEGPSFPRPPGCSAGGGVAALPQAALLLLGLLSLKRGKRK